MPLTVKYSLWSQWVLPYTAVLLICLWELHDEAAKGRPHFGTVYFVCGLLCVILFFTIRKHAARRVEVLDGGTFLEVSVGAESEKVSFSNIERIEVQKFFRLTCIVLVLKVPGKLGQIISFYPIPTRDLSGQNEVFETLKRRLEVRQ